MNLQFIILVILLSVLFAVLERYSKSEKGLASYYADFFQGQLTANGEYYDSVGYTAAHRTLDFGTLVEVIRTDRRNKRVIVRINDRGPFVEGRIIDLSKLAAKQLDMLEEGIVPVKLKIIK